jgi:hypothetical protein
VGKENKPNKKKETGKNKKETAMNYWKKKGEN